jgi:hypothetical protein
MGNHARRPPRQVVLALFRAHARLLEWLIFLCDFRSFPTVLTFCPVKLVSLFAQLIAAVFAVYSTTPPALCILSGGLAFVFGAMEGGASLLWKRFL